MAEASKARVSAEEAPRVDHVGALRQNALNLSSATIQGVASSAPTVTIALTMAALVAVNSYASPVALAITGLPMLGIAFAYRRLNKWRVNCGATYVWGGRAISPYFGFMVGWLIVLAYFLGVMSTVLPIGPYALAVISKSLATSTLWQAIAGSVGVAIVFTVAYLGIKLTARVQWILLAIEYAVVLALAGYALISVFGGSATSARFHWSWFSWSTLGGTSGLVSGALIAVYAYSGWDTTINVNEETENARVTPGNAIVASVLVVFVLDVLFTFVFQGAVHRGALEANSGNDLSYIGQQLSGVALARLAILAVLLSALGSTLGSAISGARISFAMGSDKVLPPILSRSHPRFKTPSFATVLVCLFGVATLWLYTMASSGVSSAIDTVVSSDGLLFSLFYAATGIAMAVYYRRQAFRSWRGVLEVIVIPLVSAGFLLYVSYRSVPINLGGWGSRNMVYLYVMLGIGIAFMIDARFRRRADYFFQPRETAPLEEPVD